MGTLQSKTALVTGGASGIGLEIAKVFAREKAHVVIADFNTEAGKAAEQALQEQGAEVLFVEVDLTREDQVERMVRLSLERFGELNCVCNNAALSRNRGPIEDYDLATWEFEIAGSLTTTWLSLKYEIPALRAAGGGSIVNISSNASLRGDPYNTPYASAKGAVNTLTMSVAKELAKDKIRVNAISPGVIRTPGVQRYIEENPALEKTLNNSALLGRVGEPEEIAEAVAFLSSERASFITGQLLSVDGGGSIR